MSTTNPAAPKRVYIAGPSVFLPGAKRHGAGLVALCAAHGLRGLYPLDADLAAAAEPCAHGPEARRDLARRIREANMALIRSAHGVIAEMTPFRGPSMDPGTAYEMGAAAALGLPVWAWSTDRADYAEKVGRTGALRSIGAGGVVAADGMLVEDFCLTDNLMMACAVPAVFESFEEAVRAAARHLNRG